MPAGKVDRNVLASNYQEPGQTYDDKKTEGAFEVIAQQVDENYDAFAAATGDGAITTAKIADGAVTAPKVADGSLTAAKFVAGALNNDTQNGLRITALQADYAKEVAKVFDVKGYGAKGDGVTDDTVNIRTALDACKNSGGGIILFPFGTYMVNNLAYALSSTMVVQGSGKDITILKNVNNAAGVRFFSLATGSQIKDLTLDGNKANQTSGTYAILGYGVSNCYLENVKVINQFGMGFGLSNSWNFTLKNCEVWYSGNNKCGFWVGWDINTSPQNSGGHVFEHCISKYNDLDGMILNAPNCRIFGGEYSYNGQNVIGGALGAAGIYTDTIQDNLKIIGVTFKGNTEFGINAIFRNAVIDGCSCTENALSGISIRNTSQRIKITNTECSRNGNNPTTSNPTVWGKSGIQYTGASFLVIVGCSCYDDRGPQTQAFGIQGTPQNASNGVIATGNNLKYNKTDDSNISAGYATSSHNTTNIIYANNY